MWTEEADEGKEAGQAGSRVLISPSISPIHLDLDQGKLQKTDTENTKNPRASEACGPLPQVWHEGGCRLLEEALYLALHRGRNTVRTIK